MKEADSVLIHKPLFCPVHSSEHMKYFCNTCQVLIILNVFDLLGIKYYLYCYNDDTVKTDAIFCIHG